MKKSFLVITEIGRIKNWVSMSLYEIKNNTPVFITHGQWGLTHRGTEAEITSVLLTDGLVTQQEVEDASFSLTIVGANGLCFTEVQEGNFRTPVSDGVQKMLDLSTGHIQKATDELLTTKGDIPLRYEIHEHGYVLWVMEPEEEMNWSDVPELEKINKYAHEQGCIIINLDCDADTYPDLFPIYEW